MGSRDKKRQGNGYKVGTVLTCIQILSSSSSDIEVPSEVLIYRKYHPDRSFGDLDRVANMPNDRSWEDLIVYDNEGEEHVDVGIRHGISNSSPSLKGSRDAHPEPRRGDPIPRSNQDTCCLSLDPSISTLSRALDAMTVKETIDPSLVCPNASPLCGSSCGFNSFLDQAAAAVNPSSGKGRKRSTRKRSSRNIPSVQADARQTIQGGSRDALQMDSKRSAPTQMLKEDSPPRRQDYPYGNPFDDIPVYTDRLEAATNANAELPFDFEHVDQDLIDLMSTFSPPRKAT